MANLSSKTGTVTTPVQAQISLANNATVSVQDMSAYDAQEVMGFVYIDATADLRAYFKVQVVKNGAGTYEIAAADVAGDQSGTGASAVAPVSFSMSGSILQATLPNISGFVSAYLRYQLSAPYLGGNYPLSVSASQVLGNAAGTAPAAGYIGERYAATLGSDLTGIGTTDTSILSQSLTAGVWFVTASTGYTSSANNSVFTSLYQGTTATLVGAQVPSYTASQRGHGCVSWVFILSSTTTVGVCAKTDSGTVNAGAGRNSLVAVRIG